MQRLRLPGKLPTKNVLYTKTLDQSDHLHCQHWALLPPFRRSPLQLFNGEDQLIAQEPDAFVP